MYRGALRNWLCVVVLLLAGACSDDSGSGGVADAGPDSAGDTNGDGGGDDGGGILTQTLYVHFPDGEGGRGDPAEGVHVAIDGPEGRQELTTGPDGSYQVTLGPDDSVDVTLALEGYVVVSYLGLTQARIEEALARDTDADRVALVEVFDTEAFLANDVVLSFTATGVPDGGYFCTSSEEYNWACALAGGTAVENVQRSDAEVAVTALAFDSAWKMVDFERLSLTSLDADTSQEIAFDGALDPAPEELQFQVYLPDDPDSVFRNNDVLDLGPFPFIAFDSGTHRLLGGVYDELFALDNAWVRGTLRLPPGTPDDAVYLILLSQTNDVSQRSYTYLPQDPVDDGVYVTMDAPRITAPTGSGVDLSATFEWQAIADAESYQLRIGSGGAYVWVALTVDTHAELPELPSGYDRSVDWPDTGALGTFDVWAFRDPDGVGANELAEPNRRDLRQSFNAGNEIALTGR